MIAIDSNLLIYFLANDPVFGQKSEEIFRRINIEGGSCSVLAITETMYGNIDSLSKITPLKSSQISIISTTPEVAELAGTIKIRYGVKNIDSVHLASAITAGADEFATNDQFLLKLDIKELRIRGL